MLAGLRTHLTYANVVSTLCLFVLLGGGAYAAAKLGKDSVGSKQIKAKAVKKSELAKNAVTSPKVADGSLGSKDFAPGQLPQGPPGPPGESATRMFAVVNGSTGNVNYESGGIVSSRFSKGQYTVSLDRSLVGCAVVATPGTGNPNLTGDISQPGSRATVDISSGASNTFSVSTMSNAGAFDDRSFHVAVLC